MGKKDKDVELDKDSRKRLEKLADQWAEPPSSCSLEKLTFADLRLVLEHFAPLQDLIRAITAAPTVVFPTDAVAQETTDFGAAKIDIVRVQAELEDAQAQCRALQTELTQGNAAIEKQRQALGEQEQARKSLEKQLLQTQKDLGACRAELTRHSSAPAELALLREDVELAQRLGLTDLPADATQALIQVVAVLSQRDNLQRLWDALKDRCEAQNRPAREPERALLIAALAWHNHNWRTRPYQLIDTAPYAAYDFYQHLRSSHTPTGETVGELRLPGIADGSGKPLCKALLSTR